jgi:hypothetical protein
MITRIEHILARAVKEELLSFDEANAIQAAVWNYRPTEEEVIRLGTDAIEVLSEIRAVVP